MLPYEALAYALPENILMLKYSGRFEDELRLIDEYLGRQIPDALRRALLCEKFLAQTLPGEYTLSFDEALAELRAVRPDFKAETLRKMMDDGRAEWRMVNCEPKFHEDFPASARINTPEARKSDADGGGENETDRTIREMKENGSYAVRLTVEHKLSIDDGAVEPGTPIRAWLPLPIPTDTQSEIEISADGVISPPDGAQRIAYFDMPYRPGLTFSVKYSLTRRQIWHDLDPAKAVPGFDESVTEDDLSEQKPHIRFTPYLRALADEIRGGETNPLITAKKFYDWILENCVYSYMRSYSLIESIAEFAALNGRGDCGVQALLFITLCRISGIPAKWESGHSCKHGRIGSHDWARFYCAPWGWLFCDPTNADGGRLTREFYFGHVDPRRIACNRRFQTDFSPACRFDRLDPYDSQSGEAETDARKLTYKDITTRRTLVSTEIL